MESFCFCLTYNVEFGLKRWLRFERSCCLDLTRRTANARLPDDSGAGAACRVGAEHQFVEKPDRFSDHLPARLRAASIALGQVLSLLCEDALVVRIVATPLLICGDRVGRLIAGRAVAHLDRDPFGIDLMSFAEHIVRQAPSRCWRLGMIVSELITNASRHAFRENGGTIQVEILNRETFAECIVIDNGAGSENIRPGQGMKIIRSLVVDLHGTINHRSGTTGTSVILSFPLRETA